MAEDTGVPIQPVDPASDPVAAARAALAARRAARGIPVAPGVPQPVPLTPAVDPVSAARDALAARRAARQTIATPTVPGAPPAAIVPPAAQELPGGPSLLPPSMDQILAKYVDRHDSGPGARTIAGSPNIPTGVPDATGTAALAQTLQGYAQAPEVALETAVTSGGRALASFLHSIGLASQDAVDSETARAAAAATDHADSLAAAPGAATGANITGGVASFAVNPVLAVAEMGLNKRQDALDQGATPAQAALAGAASEVGGAALGPLAKVAAPAIAPVAAAAGRGIAPIAAPVVEHGLQGVGAGAVLAGTDAAGTAVYNPGQAVDELKQIPESMGTLGGVGAALGAALGHRPVAPHRESPNVEAKVEPPVAAKPEPGAEVQPAPEAPAEPHAPPEAVAPAVVDKAREALAKKRESTSDFATSPKDPTEAIKFTAQHAKELAPERGENAPFVTTLGQKYDNLPNGEAGRFVGMERHPTRAGALQYIFQMDDGSRQTFQASDLRTVNGGIMEPVAGDIVPQVVKRPKRGGSNATSEPEKAVSPQTEEATPEVAAPEASEAHDAVEADSPESAGRGGRRGRLEELNDVQDVAASTDVAKADAADRAIKDRHLNRAQKKYDDAVATGGPEAIEAAKVQLEGFKKRAGAPSSPAAPEAKAPAEPRLASRPADTGGEPLPPGPKSKAQRKLEGGGFVPKSVKEADAAKTAPTEKDLKPVDLTPKEGDPTETSVRAGEEQRIREHGLTAGEADALRNKGDEHPIIPDKTAEAAQFASGNKKFESLEDWQAWWKDQPRANKRFIKDTAGADEAGGRPVVTKVDEAGHVEALNPQRIVRPHSADVRVTNDGAVQRLKMDVAPLHPDDNMSHTTGTVASGNVETLPRYYIGHVTDSAKPGLKGKWVVAEWDANNDVHAIEGRGQRTPFKDIPKLKAIGGDGKDVIRPGDAYDSYADAKLAAQDIVAATKRGRSVEDAMKTPKEKAGNALPRLHDVTSPERKIGAEDVEQGRVAFRSREEITSDDPFNGSSGASKAEREYNSAMKKAISILEKLKKQGVKPADIAKHPAIKAIETELDRLGQEASGMRKQKQKELGELGRRQDPMRGGHTNLPAVIADALRDLIHLVRGLLSALPGGDIKLSSVLKKARQLLNGEGVLAHNIEERVNAYLKSKQGKAVGNAVKAIPGVDAVRNAMSLVARTGHGKTPLGKALRNVLSNAKLMGKGLYSRYRHLDMSNPVDAAFANHLRLATDLADTARALSAMAINRIAEPLRGKPAEYHTFSQKVVLDDLVQMLDENKFGENDVVPFTGGLRVRDGGADAIRKAHAEVTAEAAKSPAVQKALDARNEHWREEIRGPMALIGMLPAERLDVPYFRHQVSKYYGEELMDGLTGLGSTVRAGSKPSALKRRANSGEDYNTAFEEAELEGMQMAYEALHRKLVMKGIEENFSRHMEVRDQLNEENANATEARIFDGDKSVGDGLNAIGASLARGNEAPAKYRTKYEDLLDAVQLAHEGGTLDHTFDHPDLSQFYEDMLHSRDYMATDFKRAVLGNEFREPKDMFSANADGLLPDEYAPAIIEDGNTLKMIDAVGEKIATEIREQGPTEVGEDDLVRQLAVGAAPTQLVLKAKHLRQMAETLGRVETGVMSKVAGKIARFLLYNPVGVGAYLASNAVGNASMALIANPIALNPVSLGRAAKTLFKYHKGMPLTDAEHEMMEAAVKFKVFGSHQASNFQDQAVANLSHLSRMTGRDGAGFMDSTPAGKAKWVSRLYMGNAKMGAAMVDDVFKLSLFSHLRQIENRTAGPVRKAAHAVLDSSAVNKSELEAARTPDERAAIKARQTFGDYGALSRTGSAVRKFVIPFYSWIELSKKFLGKVLRNPVAQQNWKGAPLKSAVKMTAQYGALATKIAAVHLAAAAWNQIQFERDKKLEEDAKRAGYNKYSDLIMGRTHDGRIRAYSAQTITADALRWFGMGDFDKEYADIAKGESSTRTWKDAAKDAIKAPAWQLASAVTPVVSIPVGLATDRAVSGQSMAALPIQDKATFAVKALAGSRIGQIADDTPRPAMSVADLISQARDPDEQEYYRSLGMKHDFLAKRDPNGTAPSGGDVRSESANDLHDFRRASEMNDESAMQRIIDKYYQQDAVDVKGKYRPDNVRKSMAAADPEAGLDKASLAEYKASLTPTETETLNRAKSHFDNLLDPYKNKTYARVLEKGASIDPHLAYDEDTANAKELKKGFDDSRHALVDDHSANAIEMLKDATKDLPEAATELAFDKAIKGIQKAEKYASPDQLIELEARIQRLREAARGHFAPARPTSETRTEPSKTGP